MEGIRRIGIAINVLGTLWFLGFAAAALVNAWGSDVPLTDRQKLEIYRSEIARDTLPAQPSTSTSVGDQASSVADRMAADLAQAKAIDEYFAHRPATVRKHERALAAWCLLGGTIGSVALWTFGWITSGFAVKRTTP